MKSSIVISLTLLQGVLLLSSHVSTGNPFRKFHRYDASPWSRFVNLSWLVSTFMYENFFWQWKVYASLCLHLHVLFKPLQHTCNIILLYRWLTDVGMSWRSRFSAINSVRRTFLTPHDSSHKIFKDRMISFSKFL